MHKFLGKKTKEKGKGWAGKQEQIMQGGERVESHRIVDSSGSGFLTRGRREEREEIVSWMEGK